MRVLVALDEHRASVLAALQARALFDAAEPEYLVVNVARVPAPFLSPGLGFGAVSPLPPDLGNAGLDPGRTERIEEHARDAGLDDAELEVVAGDPVAELCRAADEHEADLIVVGAHDKSFLDRLFDPSVSAGVLKSTSRPVLVVSDREG